jgi:hypothetical protein
MDVSLLLLADYANVEQGGKINVMGIFDRINAPQFPVRHPLMVLVARLTAELGETGRERQVTIKLVDEDGGDVALVLDQTISVQRGNEGQPPEFRFILELRDVVFPQPGTYSFVVLIDQEPRKDLPLWVMHRPAAPAQPG